MKVIYADDVTWPEPTFERIDHLVLDGTLYRMVKGAKMPLVERARVTEWRITRPLGNYNVRYWIESDPAFGGVSYDKALSLVAAAHDLALNTPGLSARFSRIDDDPKVLADFLFDNTPAASSVEVCNGQGNGVTIHRDWP